MMDANGELDEEQLNDFVQEHGLHNLIAETNEDPAPRTYQGSGRRLDYILGNDHVLSAVVKSGGLGSNDMASVLVIAHNSLLTLIAKSCLV
jgi:hypothetical protein